MLNPSSCLSFLFHRRFLGLCALLWLTAPVTAASLPPELSNGFVVWETNRTGAWRIFHQEISNGTPRQLTPDEESRDHFAPQLCPEGRRLIYLSFPRGRHGYSIHAPDILIPMMMLDLDKPEEPPPGAAAQRPAFRGTPRRGLAG